MSTADTTPPASAGTTPEAPAASPDLKRAALGSAVWLAFGFGGSQAIRFVSTIVLPGLLYPEAFGLAALGTALVVGVQMFADIGIRTSIVQSPRGDDPRFLATAWTVSVVRGFVLWGVNCLLAYPAAYWRPQPEPLLMWMLPVMGFTAAVEGFISTALYTLNRRLNPGRAVLVELSASAVGTAVSITWAWLRPSPWALVAGALTASVLKTLLTHLVLPGGQSWFCWDREAIQELSHIGRWVYLSTVCTFLASYADRLVVGFWSVATLGVYNVAVSLAQVPVALMHAVSAQLLFPLFSRLLQRGHAPVGVFGPVHLAGDLAGGLLVAGLLAVGPTAVFCLWDPRFHDVAWMLRLLAIGAWLQILEGNAEAILFAQAQAHVPAASNAAKAAALFVLMPLGYSWFGVTGVILALVAGDLVRYLVTANAIRRRGLPLLRYDVPATVLVFALGVAADALAYSLWPGGPRVEPPGLSGAWLIGSGLPTGTEALGSPPWGGYKRDWGVLLARLATAATTVVIAWAAAAWWLRSRNVLRWRW